MDESVVSDTRRVLVQELARADELVDRLEVEHARMMSAAEESNADDEHDPEGATLAFERQQLAALLDQTRVSRADLVDALVRVDTGAYGVCERCGAAIGDARLEARPAARTCITCAA
jgi:DnaK suppressor protein